MVVNRFSTSQRVFTTIVLHYVRSNYLENPTLDGLKEALNLLDKTFLEDEDREVFALKKNIREKILIFS